MNPPCLILVSKHHDVNSTFHDYQTFHLTCLMSKGSWVVKCFNEKKILCQNVIFFPCVITVTDWKKMLFIFKQLRPHKRKDSRQFLKATLKMDPIQLLTSIVLIQQQSQAYKITLP